MRGDIRKNLRPAADRARRVRIMCAASLRGLRVRGLPGCVLVRFAPAPGCASCTGRKAGRFWGLIPAPIILPAVAVFHALQAFSTPGVLKLILVSSLKYARVCIWLLCCYALLIGAVMYL